MKTSSGIKINPAKAVRNQFVEISKLNQYIINKFAHCYHSARRDFTEDDINHEKYIYNCYNNHTLFPNQILEIVYRFIDYSKIFPVVTFLRKPDGFNFEFSFVEIVRMLDKKIQKTMADTINDYYRLNSLVENYTSIELINVYSYIIISQTVNIYNLIKIYY